MSTIPLNYDDVLKKLPATKHLLLGNGFSIACDPIFDYGNLFEYVKQKGLSSNAIPVFDYLGTNNFEGVLRLLQDSIWVKSHYKMVYGKKPRGTIEDDLDSVKKALVEAIAQTHLSHSGLIADSRKERCLKFIEPYKNVFTTNYDLLLYWVAMHGLEQKIEARDGFLACINEPTAPYLVFSQHLGDRKGILFLHGGLHLYLEEGETRKHSWRRTDTPIIELVKNGLQRNQYPHFVAEGLASKKLEQIHMSDYLSYCLGKLSRIEQSLVVFGLSFGKSDQHILNAIADNLNLADLYIGVFGDLNSPSNKSLLQSAEYLHDRRRQRVVQAKKGKDITISYYDSESAPVWD